MESVEALVAHIQGLSGSADELAQLHGLLKQADGDALRVHSAGLLPFLSHLHPGAHSLGFLYLLDSFVSSSANLRAHAGGDLLVTVADFLTSCSADQIRLAPDKFLNVCRVLKNEVMQLNAPIRGIAPLRAAVRKIQTSSEQLTPLHAEYLMLCLLAKQYKAGLSVLEDDIFEVDQPKDLFLYCYYGGMIYIGLKKFRKALELLHNAVTAPMSSLNAITVEAYKKYVLVSLIQSGQVPSFPKYTSSTAQRNLKNHTQIYVDLATCYGTGSYSDLETFIQSNAETFQTDNNFGLVKQVLSSMYKRNIQRLTQTYLTLSLEDIASSVQLNTPKEAEMHVLRMIEDGEIHATINQKDGMVSFNEDPEQYKSSEMVEHIDSSIQRTWATLWSSEVAAEQGGASRLFTGGTDFAMDNNTFAEAHIRAAFYPKFENEKCDQETRKQMIEMVSHGFATMEVTLKHSGSLFMYAGHHGAYSKNSFGNIYTAVGVFVLDRMFHEAWGKEAPQMQVEFNDYLQKNRINISMELVTAELGDHGQRPKDDYAVVTAVTELGHGKPKFYSTPDVIAFCRKWRLSTNHVWLFSTRKSATSFFVAYDALCEVGTATPVCEALDKIADISVPGSKDHLKVQGEILEGLVARIVSHQSSDQMKEVLRSLSQAPLHGVDSDLGPSLREICAANRSDEKQKIKALLENVGSSMCPDHSDWFGNSSLDAQSRNADKSLVTYFLEAHPTDYATKKLQEMFCLMKQRHFPAAFKCYLNYQNVDSLSYKMVIHVRNDSIFRRYQQEMRKNQGLWPLYRGFFIHINLFKANNKKGAELSKDSNTSLEIIDGAVDSSSSAQDGLAGEDSSLMLKLKFLNYKIRTFLIRDGLSTLFKEDGPSNYQVYYLRQMKNWGTSARKQKELCKLLDQWAVHITGKCGNKPLSSSAYLDEAEPFLEQYANQDLVGAAGVLVQAENLRDGEDDLQPERGTAPCSPTTSLDVVSKTEGLIVFFPGIPGCAKSALCKEILEMPGGLGDNRPLHCLTGDLIGGRYWQKVADKRKEEPFRITLADKNAPNEKVWRQIEDICRTTKAAAAPVIPDSEGTDTNPFSLEALAVFMFRVLQRVNHDGHLDEALWNAGYVLLKFYNLYEGKSRSEFESDLYERFGFLVKMPLLKPDRSPLPGDVKSILDEGLSLFIHGRAELLEGSYVREWAQWEKRLREILFGNADYLKSIQVPFEVAVKEVVEQLKAVAKGDTKTPDTVKRRFGNIIFAAVTLSQADILGLVWKVAENDTDVNNFLNDIKLEDNLMNVHVTLAHKRAHGVAAVASYSVYLNQKVPVSFNAFFYNDKMAALGAHLGMVNGEAIVSKNDFPHCTLWTVGGVTPKEANTLPQLVSEGKAKRVLIDSPITISGVVNFY